MYRRATLITALVTILCNASTDSSTAVEIYHIAVTIRQCLTQKYPGLCLKERALEALNETVYMDEPIVIGILRIEKNSDYNWNSTQVGPVLPNEISRRSIVLNDALYDKIKEYFKSRTIRLNVDEAFEGRKKGGGGGGGMMGGKGKGGMMLMAAACMGTGMMMGKMGMMAMAAMMMSKIALLLSAIMMLKKSKGGGDDEGKEKQIKIVYATTSGGGGDYGKGGGGGGGGGGWHRSMTNSHEPQTITYRAQIPQDASANIVYEAKPDRK
ncbi:uncharacterized protein LOC126742152 isoform X2 [Anthonomus grandis grandis]|uniref:uncharacterized protein LOC126742152 isoform X2 n=1 Tax=Anthonomus grandis grandis TaxID=2921223 RepID=UPI002166125D|nr:uncharacterized protein LOC126742152 isoform X2 [Anthonomus grandis grandis]